VCVCVCVSDGWLYGIRRLSTPFFSPSDLHLRLGLRVWDSVGSGTF